MSSTINKIKAHMDSCGLSAYALAKDHGFPRSSLSDWFSGKSVPSIGKVEKLCKALNLSINISPKK